MSDQTTAQTTKAILYDADAEQRIPLQFERRGRLFNVVHVFAALTDDDIANYERGRNLRLTAAETGESDERDAMAIQGDTFGPAVELWEKKIVKVENYECAGKDDFKKLVPTRHKAFAVQSALMPVEILPLPLVGDSEAFPEGEEDNTSTIRLRALFGDKQVITEHVLRAPSADDMAAYRSLMSRALVVKGQRFGKQEQRIPSRARRLGELYNQMFKGCTGYVGRIPLHHRMAVALEHFRGEEESLGN
jgi:hypothetical protein